MRPDSIRSRAWYRSRRRFGSDDVSVRAVGDVIGGSCRRRVHGNRRQRPVGDRGASSRQFCACGGSSVSGGCGAVDRMHAARDSYGPPSRQPLRNAVDRGDVGVSRSIRMTVAEGCLTPSPIATLGGLSVTPTTQPSGRVVHGESWRSGRRRGVDKREAAPVRGRAL